MVFFKGVGEQIFNRYVHVTSHDFVVHYKINYMLYIFSAFLDIYSDIGFTHFIRSNVNYSNFMYLLKLKIYSTIKIVPTKSLKSLIKNMTIKNTILGS